MKIDNIRSVIILENILQIEELFYNSIKKLTTKKVNNYERGMKNEGMAGY